MQRSLIATLQQGVRYSQSWPLVSELNSVFPENKIIRLTKTAQQLLPAVSVISLMMQLHWMGQSYLAPALASTLFMLSLPLLRFGGGVLQKVMPKDETTAVSEDSLIGRVAIITLGQARQGFPAEARVKDQHGYSHYIRLEPDSSDLSFAQGSEVATSARR